MQKRGKYQALYGLLWAFSGLVLMAYWSGFAACQPPAPIEATTELTSDASPTEQSTDEALNPDQTPEAPPDSPTTTTLQQGDASVVIGGVPWTLVLKRGTTTLATLPLAGLQLGVVPFYDDTYNYDPYWLAPPHDTPTQPDELKWLSPTRATQESTDATSATYILEYPEGIKGKLVFKAEAKGTIQMTWSLTPLVQRAVYLRIRWQVDKSENYYGLGEYFDQVAQRGTIRAMQIEADLKMEGANNEAHVPVPFFTGTRGWGFFVKSFYPGTFNMGQTTPEIIEITYHAPQLDTYLFVAQHPLDVPGLYTRISGAPAVPARWAFGTLLWRDENKDQAEVLDDAAQIRKHDLAISALWIDRPYDTHVNSFGWDPKRFPQPKEMLASLHDNGFRLGLWSTPYLEPGAADHARFSTQGWFVKTGLRTNKWSDPVDLTNPKAFSAWQALIDKYTSMGIEGFKLDYGEDIQLGLRSGRLRYQFNNGEDERTMHHKYTHFYHRAYAEKLPKAGGFLICRGGTWGSQVYASIIWPGDLDADFRTHRTCEGNECHVGGLIASIIGGLSLSQSGFPFYGSDTGGYRHSRPTKEVFMRWGQQTALSTIMQIGGTDPNANPWDFTAYGRSKFDQEVLDMYRRYIRLHTRLFPYIYTYGMAANQHQRGPARPYGMMFPEDNFHPNDQYFLGEFLLVAPVVQSTTEREVRFPQAHDWIDYWDQTLYKGGTTTNYKAPLDRLPLFLRVGSILPLLRPDIDTLSPTKTPGVISAATDPGVLYARIVPGKDASFKLYDDTQITLTQGTPITIAIQSGKEFKSGAVFEVLHINPPTKVEIANAPLTATPDKAAFDLCQGACWFFDVANQTLWLRAPTGPQEIKLSASTRTP